MPVDRFETSLQVTILLIRSYWYQYSRQVSPCGAGDSESHSNATRPLIALEQADGRFELNTFWRTNYLGDAGDAFSNVSNLNAFSDFSTPSSHLYNGMSTYITVDRFSASASVMSISLTNILSYVFLPSISNP